MKTKAAVLFEVGKKLEIEDVEVETIAGLVLRVLGHVPKPGEAVERAGLRFTVEEVVNRRIKSLRVERVPPAAAPPPPAAEGPPA